MGKKGTTVCLTTLTLVGNLIAFGLWGLLSTPLSLLFPYYLIWVDSKKPQDQQFRFCNSKL